MARPLQCPPARWRSPLQKLQDPGVVRVRRRQVGGGAAETRDSPGRHRPEEPGVDERLVQDGQALLRPVDVGEVEGVDLAAGRLSRPASILHARLATPTDRPRIGRRWRDRSFTFPSAQHPQCRILVEEVLEVRRPRPRQSGEKDRPHDVGFVDVRARRRRTGRPRCGSAGPPPSCRRPARALLVSIRPPRSWLGRRPRGSRRSGSGSGSSTSVSAWARSMTSRRSAAVTVGSLSIGPASEKGEPAHLDAGPVGTPGRTSSDR